VERLAILPIDAPKTKETESATIVDRRVPSPIRAPTHVLINHQLNIGVILLTALLHFTLLLSFAYHLFSALAEYQPCYFPTATQTYCLEEEDGLEFFDEEFLAVHCPSCHSCGVMKSSAVPLHFA
jgi:hypothetical protein